MKTIHNLSLVNFSTTSSRLFFSVFLMSICLSGDLIAQNCGADTSFTDVIYLIDNSGSINEEEFESFETIITTSIADLQSGCSGALVAVLHYGGNEGKGLAIEYPFSNGIPISSVNRQFCTTRAGSLNLCTDGGGDDLNHAIGSIIDSMQMGRLTHNQDNNLSLVILTDAFGFDTECSLPFCSKILPTTNIDIMKSNYDVDVTVVGISAQAEETALAIYASPGGDYNGGLFNNACTGSFDGCTLPRKYIEIDFNSDPNSVAAAITATVSCSISMNPGISVDAGVNQNICADLQQTVTLTATPSMGVSPYRYLWSNGAGSRATANVSPSATTTYFVTITDANTCTAIDSVTVIAAPCCSTFAVDAGTDTSICSTSGTNVSIIANASGGSETTVTYAWNNGLADGASQMVSPEATTTYIVTATDEIGCEAIDQIIVSVNVCCDGFSVSAGADKEICSDLRETTVLSASITGGAAPYTTTWDNGIGNIAMPTVAPSTTTTYTVTIIDNAGCVTTDQITVSSNNCCSGFSVSTGADIAICSDLNESTTLSASITGGTAPYSTTWDNGIGNIDMPTVAPSATTTYNVTVTDATGCVTTDQITVTAGGCCSGFSVSAGADIAICSDLNESTTLSASITGGTAPYITSWDNGLGNALMPTVAPSVTTTYNVTITDATGCVTTDQITVSSNNCCSGFSVSAGADIAICSDLNESTTLSASITGGTAPYITSWDNGIGNTDMPTVAPSATTTYNVTIADATGCVTTDQITVTAGGCCSGFSVSAGADIAICSDLNESTTLSASITGGTAPYITSWDNGLGNALMPTVAPSATTTYTVTITDAAGCITTDQIIVSANNCCSGFSVSAGSDKMICSDFGESATLSASVTGGVMPYVTEWSNEIGKIDMPTVTPSTTTTYTVTITDAAGCMTTDDVTVTVDPMCGPDCEPDTTFNDVIFLIDNSGSISDEEFAAFENIIVASLGGIRNSCPSSRRSVIHYGGENGTNTIVEYALGQTSVINSISRQYCNERTGAGICVGSGGDDLNNAIGDIMTFLNDGTLNRDQGNKLNLVILTDAFGFDTTCPQPNCSLILPTTNIDLMKANYNVDVSVVGVSSQAEEVLLGIYASPGGTFNSPLFEQECTGSFDGCTLPRKYVQIEFNTPPQDVANMITSFVSCEVEIVSAVTADAGLDQTLCEEDDETVVLTAQLIDGVLPFTFEWDNGLGSGNGFSVSPTVTTTYSVTITDANGCSDIDHITITIEDCFPDCIPIIMCPQDYEGCPKANMEPMMTGMATAIKADSTCSEPIITYRDDVMPIGTCEGQMIIMRTWIATDSNNADLFSTCIQKISLLDTIPPKILSCPPSTILDPDNPVHEWADPIVEENCGFILSYSVPNGSRFPTGVTKVLATAADMCGNIDTCSFMVTVPEEVEIICEEILLTCIDTLLPSMIPDIETDSPCELCLTDSINCVQTNATIDSVYKAGETTIYEITYIATDLCGTDDTCTTNVIIDNTGRLDCPADINIQAPPFGFTNVTWEKPVFKTCCTTCKTKEIPGFLYMGQLGDSYYYCSYARVNWSRAQLISTQNGGNLAVINSAEENEFIGRRLIERNAYIGLSDSDEEGTFTWVNGDPLNYKKWKRNQPDDSDEEDFVEMDAQGYWYDVDGSTKREFVMEIEGCDQVTQTSGPMPGSKFRVGTTTITYVAEDGCGNVDSCSFDIVLTPFSASPVFIAEKSIDYADLISINPNPASTTLYIDAVTNDQIESVEVYQMNGQRIDVKRSVNNTSAILDVNEYQAGLHLVRVRHHSGSVSMKKIVIE